MTLGSLPGNVGTMSDAFAVGEVYFRVTYPGNEAGDV